MSTDLAASGGRPRCVAPARVLKKTGAASTTTANGTRLSHRIAFTDERTPQRRTKPKGIIGAELWVKLTALGEVPPSGPADLSFLMLSTRSPAIAEYGGADAGKTAHYMVRWLSRRGEPGPWSETASATVGA